MRLIDADEFRRWAASKQILARRDGHPTDMHFGPKPFRVAWPWPRAQGWTRPWYLADFIFDAVQAAGLQRPDGWYLWPRYGNWNYGSNAPFYRVRNTLLKGLGIPVPYEGAADFAESEVDAAAAAVFARCFIMDDCEGVAPDHVYVYPHHGQLSLYFVDEELTWVEAASPEPVG